MTESVDLTCIWTTSVFMLLCLLVPECITTQERYIPYLDFLMSVGLTSMGRLHKSKYPKDHVLSVSVHHLCTDLERYPNIFGNTVYVLILLM